MLYDTRHALDPFGVLWPEEIERAVALLLGPQQANNHARLHAALTSSVDRFTALGEDEKARFRDTLARFTHIYSFLPQIVSFTDTKLEEDYLFCRTLATFIRPAGEDRAGPGTSRRDLR